MPEELVDQSRRSWPQRILIGFNLMFVVGLVVASSRLDSFEQAVESIVRIEVPAGVLADLPGSSEAASAAADLEGGDRSDDPETAEVDRFEPHPAGPPRNVLLIGIDSAVGLDPDDPAAQRDRSAAIGLADTIMLVRLDPALARASIMSLPRDLYVTIYRAGLPVRREKLASSVLVGGMELGAPTLVETVTNNFDVPIHNFVVVDFHGFEQLVEELGGVPLWFPYPVRDVGSGLMVAEAGCAMFDGRDSLAFVRSRKMEAFVGGLWHRVGVWNDLERNQRQQDFLIAALQRTIARGARSMIIRDDLIRAATETVVLDDRLTLGTLLHLGRAFSGFEPEHLQRHVLPVTDATVGKSAVLRLDDGARDVFDVFRGVTLRPEKVPVKVVDARGPVDEDVPAPHQLERKGFPVEASEGPPTKRTTIRATIEDYDAAVLLGQYVEPMPHFEFTDSEAVPLRLTLGTDFDLFLLVPRDLEAVDTMARAALPIPDGFEAASPPAPGATARAEDRLPNPVPVRAGGVSPMQLVREIDGRPPDGQRCG
ncbi:MAG: LCP family protein [Actinomycetota bacterium]|nr:LCP family protein [Actinomycetota bacterium]